MSEQNIIEWDNRLAVRIPLIDNQHKKLLAMANDLYFACNYSTDSGKNQFERTVHDAVAYIRYHFSTEGRIMERTSYPDRDDHNREHTEFIKKVLENVKAFEEGKLFVPFRFVRFLRDWVLSHIAITDSKLGIFLTGLQKTGKPGVITMKVQS
ncbi:MAG: bacteriohemerythrin [Spirochaetaceae bacterium]|jgi:hemerythrin|nr:bacteriohemerythrin [Spirochaetaceae bacterium]